MSGEEVGRDRASIERSRRAFSSRGWIGGSRRGGISRSTRRGVSQKAARLRVSGHAPRVCGVCRPCDRRPFRRGVTRIHRRRRRELNATRREPPFFRARARGRHLFSRAEIEVARSRVAPRPNALVPRLARAARTRPRSVPPTPAWGCGRACWWRSAWRRRRCASRRARGRGPRGRDAGAPPSRDPPSPTRKGHRTRSRESCFCPSSS